MRLLLATLSLLAATTGASAAPCAQEDYETRVSGESECLLMRRYGPTRPATLVVWLHGNVSTGGPANSHFRIAEKLAAEASNDQVLVVALVRPGYPDGSGESSSGNDYGRADNWPRATVAEIGTSIARLRQQYRPARTVIVGHSGGAAITAVLMGLQPQLADAALLLACPCDMVAWRVGRRGPAWSSEDPMRWIAEVSTSAKVIALTGDQDRTTDAGLAQAYVAALQARGVTASFESVPGTGHIDLLKSPAVLEASLRLVRQ